MILTAHVGTNAELIERVSRLYLKSGMKVADVTYGRGVFWKEVVKNRRVHWPFRATSPVPKGYVQILRSDIDPQGTVKKMDFRALTYRDGTFDVVVLDPPYMHGGATVKGSISKCYGNRQTKYASHESIMELYRQGIAEAWRVLKPGGTLWVKCQDEIESGKQRWSHFEIFFSAMANGRFVAKDLFVLVQKTVPARRQAKQYHARKNHSMLWIFEKKK